MTRYNPLGLEDVMPFGKFRGTKIRVLLFNELGYMEWVTKNTGLELTKEAFDKMEGLQEQRIESDPMGNGPMRGMDAHWGPA